MRISGVFDGQLQHANVQNYIIFEVRGLGAGTPGCILDATIYDEDGDGKFEVYVPFSGMPHIPQSSKQ